MKQGFTKSDFAAHTQPAELKELYNLYADKLLGYVLTTLPNRGLAEDIVVKIFSDIFSNNNLIPRSAYSNTWSWLTSLSQTELNKIQNTGEECKSVSDNNTYVQSHRYLSKMSDVQRIVFCGAYYHRKSITVLAVETGFSEDDLRIALKEAFKIIRGAKDED